MRRKYVLIEKKNPPSLSGPGDALLRSDWTKRGPSSHTRNIFLETNFFTLLQ